MRSEVKFIVAAHEISYFIEWLFSKPAFRKVYPGRVVNSTYFDTPSLRSATDNISGIARREKFRLRWYGSGAESYGGRYEIKQKVGTLGTKLSQPVNFDLGELADQTIPMLTENLFADRVTEFWREFPLLTPSLKVQYHREYYEAFDGIRLTIDDQLKFFRVPDSTPAITASLEDARSLTVSIVELKFLPSRRHEVSDLLEDFPFYPKRCSKYVYGLSLFSRVSYL